MSQWISIKDGLPEERDRPYQVVAAQKKEMGGVYAGTYNRIFAQDWHIRKCPHNFVGWKYDDNGLVYVGSEFG